jgi:hypothetical protein
MEHNPQFLKQKYNLHDSGEVKNAADWTNNTANAEYHRALKEWQENGSPEDERPGEVEHVSQKPADRIQNYLNRLERVIHPAELEGHPGSAERRKERNLSMLKRALYDNIIIKPEEIPEAYFDNQRRMIREQGHGDVDITHEQRKQLAEVIIADQKSSLDVWTDYLTSDDTTYPDWLKYYAFRSVLFMGSYDKESKKFSKRDKGTVKPFPDLNREALAYVLDALENKYKGSTSLEVLEAEDKAAFARLLQGESFSKLYAWAIEKVTCASPEQLAVTKGVWIKYPQGSDHTPLVKSLQGHGTGWCTAGESIAHAQLKDGDFYVYYSLDKDGQPTLPRAAIRMSKGSIIEVRGVAAEQHLDSHIAPVVEEKLAQFPDGKGYEKKVSDMKQLTAIYNKCFSIDKFTGEKMYLNPVLTKDNLTFLYEVNASIEGFGYQKDPRIKELRDQRDPTADIPIVFECAPEQIATNIDQINESTEAFVGKLAPGILDKIQQFNIENFYTEFPEGRIQRDSITIGGKTKEQLQQEMLAHSKTIGSDVKDMMQSPDFTTQADAEVGNFILLRVRDLGFAKRPTTDQLYQRAHELGLDLCPAETGPNFPLQYAGELRNKWVHIAMKPIAYRDSNSAIFRVNHEEEGLWMLEDQVESEQTWYLESPFLFRLPKLEA